MLITKYQSENNRAEKSSRLQSNGHLGNGQFLTLQVLQNRSINNSTALQQLTLSHAIRERE